MFICVLFCERMSATHYSSFHQFGCEAFLFTISFVTARGEYSQLNYSYCISLALWETLLVLKATVHGEL